MPSLPTSVAVSDPFFRLTENDHRGLVATFAILSIVVVVLIIGLQIYMRHRKGPKSFDGVDLILHFGALLMLCYSAICICSVKAGLGLPKTDENVDIDALNKASLWRTTLFVPTNSSLTYHYELSTDDVRELDRGNFGSFLRQALYVVLGQRH